MNITLILAQDQQGGIGLNNQLPWHIPSELKHFKETTINQNILVGRQTFETLPKLKNRNIIVVTSNPDYPHQSIQSVNQLNDQETYYLIGGAKLAKSWLKHINTIILTTIHQSYQHDVNVNDIHPNFNDYIHQHYDIQNQTHHHYDNEPPYTITTYIKKKGI